MNKFAAKIAFIFLLASSVSTLATENVNDEGSAPLNQELLQKRLSGDVDSVITNEQKTPDFAYGAFQRGEYLTAFQIALPLAEQGDAAAQTLIAELYEKGFGIAQDTKQAAKWYEIAAKSGNREAQFSYALKLLKGKDVPQNKQMGEAMMKDAAEAGHPIAMFNHANQIIANRPTSAGYRLALPFYQKAAANRLADAYYALSVIYKEGLTTGIQEPDKAREWLEKAARAGVDTAQVELGIALVNGTGGPKDLVAAFNVLNNAAVAGNVIAQNRIAHMYLQGIGVKPSLVEAAKWHIIARRAGRFDLVLDRFMEDLDGEMRQKALTLANRWPGV